MTKYDDLAKRAESAGYEIFWLGPVSHAQIQALEASVGLPLSNSFKSFLEVYGGGGVVGAEVSGVEDDDALIDAGGTVLGDTRECRERYGLPGHLIVIYFHDDEVCWCLDASRFSQNECPVVSYNLFSKEVDRELAPSFEVFFEEHMSLYGEKG